MFVYRQNMIVGIVKKQQQPEGILDTRVDHQKRFQDAESK
jgi:hypothetical protein